MSKENNGEILLLTGPHGAGKDSVEKSLRATDASMERIVRHITRKRANEEVDGLDYHFVSRHEFRNIIEDDGLIEYAEYPDVLSGTTYRAINEALCDGGRATLTLNMEDALPLMDKINCLGYVATTYFISPVSFEDFCGEPQKYLDALRSRMEVRGRPDDRIENKIAKAAFYRTLYFKHERSLHYISNIDGGLDEAVTAVRSTF